MYDINILVNGSRCKQYFHEGKRFIEAKDGSEYTIEIKNNTWQRVLAVCSVDGLDILTGKTAIETNPGYVISGYNTGKFDGFRVSDNKVAKFVFGKKGESYAADKGDGSEKNVGVIGIRIFQEKITPPSDNVRWYKTTITAPAAPTIWTEHTYTCGSTADMCDYSCDDVPTKGITRGMTSNTTVINASLSMKRSSDAVYESKTFSFDMGTKWGESKESKVVEVDFEKGILAISTDIFYASRQSLIDMGVPIGNEKQVNFPTSFADSKYAKPPTNWKG